LEKEDGLRLRWEPAENPGQCRQERDERLELSKAKKTAPLRGADGVTQSMKITSGSKNQNKGC